MDKYDYIGKKSEGFVRVKNGFLRDCRCGYINESEQEIIPLIFTGVKDFHEGLAAVKVGNWSMGKWGFIDIHGELTIPYLFDKPRPFSCGMAKVVYENEWCFIDRNGNKVISLKDYDGGSNFHDGYAIVSRLNKTTKEETYGIIDKTGKELIPCNINCYQQQSFFRCSSLESCVQEYNDAIRIKKPMIMFGSI